MIYLATTAKGHEWCHSRQIQMKRVCCPVLAGWLETGVYGDNKSNLEGFFIYSVESCIWRVRNMYALQKMNDFSGWNFHPDIDVMVKSFEIWKHHLRKKGATTKKETKPLRQSFVLALIMSGKRNLHNACFVSVKSKLFTVDTCCVDESIYCGSQNRTAIMYHWIVLLWGLFVHISISFYMNLCSQCQAETVPLFIVVLATMWWFTTETSPLPGHR